MLSVLQCLVEVFLADKHRLVRLLFSVDDIRTTLSSSFHSEGPVSKLVKHPFIAYLQPLRLSIDLRWISTKLLHLR